MFVRLLAASLIALAALSICRAADARTRLWIDTDPACGLGAMSDPDDCFALLYLLTSPAVEIAGVSTTFGNASLDETTRIARELLNRLRLKHRPALVAGAADAAYWWRPPATPASHAIAVALEEGSLTFVALGPLTNLAAALAERPGLAPRLTDAIAVMGKRPGEIFHPAEGSPDALLGHGPAFSDLNFAKDPRAAKLVFASAAHITLVPYAAGKTQSITGQNLAALRSTGGAAAWVAQRAQGWLDFWRDAVGRDGFYPFDLVAAIVATDPNDADCADALVVIKHDDKIGWFGFGPRSLLFVSRNTPNAVPVTTCKALNGRAVDRLLSLSKEADR